MSLLASSSKDVAGATNSITGKPSFDAGGAFNVGAKSKIWGLARVNWFGLKVGGGDDRDGSRYALAAGFTQFVNPETITKLFWSAGLAMDNIAVKAGNNLAEAKVESLTLPLILGLEHQLTDMWALRASVRQNVLVGQTKIAVGGGADFNGNNSPNSTTLAAGLGMKWKKLELDGTFAGATTGALNAATLLAQMGLMYSF
jgi:hypothetical protein